MVAATARPQSPQPLPPVSTQAPRLVTPDSLMLADYRIVQVLTAGSWIDGVHRGHYRVVVIRDGIDFTHHTTYVQWLERQGLTERVTLVSTLDLQNIAPQWFALLSPVIKMSPDGVWYMNVDVQDGPERPSQRRVKFILGPPGHIRLK